MNLPPNPPARKAAHDEAGLHPTDENGCCKMIEFITANFGKPVSSRRPLPEPPVEQLTPLVALMMAQRNHLKDGRCVDAAVGLWMRAERAIENRQQFLRVRELLLESLYHHAEKRLGTDDLLAALLPDDPVEERKGILKKAFAVYLKRSGQVRRAAPGWPGIALLELVDSAPAGENGKALIQALLERAKEGVAIDDAVIIAAIVLSWRATGIR